MRAQKIIVAVVAAGVMAAAGGYKYWTTTPEYSLTQIQTAFEDHDLALFHKHVDVDALVGRGVDALLEDSLEDTPQGGFGGKLAAGMMAMIKPTIIAFAKNKIELAVEGARPTTTEQESKHEKSLAAVDGFFVDGAINKKYLKTEGKIAYLGLERFDEKLQSPVNLEIKLRKMGGYWQAVELSNLAQMIKKNKELKEARLEELNAPIGAQLDNSIHFNFVSKKSIAVNNWKKKVEINVNLNNKTGEEISKLDFTVDLVDESDNIIRTLVLTASNVPAGKNLSFIWEYDINQFISKDVALHKIQDGKTSSYAIVNKVAMANGTTIELLSNI